MIKHLKLAAIRSAAIRGAAVRLAASVLCAVSLAASAPSALAADASDYHARVIEVLKRTPLIDGHNDLPWEIRARFKGRLTLIDLASDTSKIPPPPDEAALMTDIPRLRAGLVGGQFWSVWVPVDITGAEAVQMTVEQIDLVKRMAARYPKISRSPIRPPTCAASTSPEGSPR